PDLIILDLEMIGITGLIMLDILSQNRQNIPILICSGNLNEHNKQRVINAGAKGFLSKTEGMQQIREAIEALLAGKTYPKEACQYLSETQTSLLSNRQRIILGLMQSGLSNSEMAEALYVSTNTIKTHVRLMYNSLDVNSRIACINKARELGLIDPI
ncbi:response regulator transcription factor, partial [Bermanella marisrubri]